MSWPEFDGLEVPALAAPATGHGKAEVTVMAKDPEEAAEEQTEEEEENDTDSGASTFEEPSCSKDPFAAKYMDT
eukprot:8615963-Lingulodinium_polyedra.AAC.1